MFTQQNKTNPEFSTFIRFVENPREDPEVGAGSSDSCVSANSELRQYFLSDLIKSRHAVGT